MKTKALLLACLIATPASAAVTKLTIEKTSTMPGGYELLEGHFSGALDPGDPHNAIINDIKLAPKNAAGRVEYSATFAIARPTGSLSGVLVYDVSNRGRGAVAAIGDGHINVLSGWQGDLDDRPEVHQRIDLPSAPVTGPAPARPTGCRCVRDSRARRPRRLDAPEGAALASPPIDRRASPREDDHGEDP